MICSIYCPFVVEDVQRSTYLNGNDMGNVHSDCLPEILLTDINQGVKALAATAGHASAGGKNTDSCPVCPS